LPATGAVAAVVLYYKEMGVKFVAAMCIPQLKSAAGYAGCSYSSVKNSNALLLY